MYSIQIILLLKISISFTFNIKVNYYEWLWKINTKIADDWVRPTANNEFKGFSRITIDYGSYDFIVVGAGSTGATLATRLAENPDFDVLLLEAGEDETDFSKIPAAINSVLRSSKNWGYLTTPQKNACFENINRQCDMDRGKGLGGSSSINAMMYARGSPLDYDRWAELGNEGWSFEDVLPYFLKLENASGIHDADDNLRGFHGPLTISYPIPKPQIGEIFFEATKEIGYKVLDYNGWNQTVGNYVQMSTRNGVRDSTNQAYLKRIGSRLPNLHIMTKTLATELILNKDVVTGVEFLSNGMLGKATARKEVIVSGGAINSPQLLMLSGIGPKSHLKKIGIPLVKDLPVGRNLDDHPSAVVIQMSTNLSITIPTLREMLKDYVNGRGFLTRGLGNCVIYPRNVYPNLEIIATLPANLNETNYFDKKSRILHQQSNQMQDNIITTVIALLHPKSKGKVSLKSRDPTEFPNIDPNYLDHPQDLAMLYEGIQFWKRLLQTDAMKKINATFIKNKFPACQNIADDRRYWYCEFRYIVKSLDHLVSTCRMGIDPATSVVNNELLVHGFKNLRVADASIMPTSISGHTNAACIMIGEKIADVIKKYHSNTA